MYFNSCHQARVLQCVCLIYRSDARRSLAERKGATVTKNKQMRRNTIKASRDSFAKYIRTQDCGPKHHHTLWNRNCAFCKKWKPRYEHTTLQGGADLRPENRGTKGVILMEFTHSLFVVQKPGWIIASKFRFGFAFGMEFIAGRFPGRFPETASALQPNSCC